LLVNFIKIYYDARNHEFQGKEMFETRVVGRNEL